MERLKSRGLTIKSVESAPVGTARREVPDAILPGLYLVIQTSGAKSWAVRYRANGRPRKLTLGAYPAIELTTARELARKALRSVAEGTDPAAEKKEAKRSGTKAQRAARNRIEVVVEEFLDRHAKANTREATWKEYERLLRREVLPRWKNRQADEIGRRDILDLLDVFVDRGSPVMANRALATVRKLFAWCVDRDILQVSPCAGVKPPSMERGRDRILTDDELRLVWTAAGAVGWPFGPMVKMLILTGQRRDEVSEMRRMELNKKEKLWLIPKERTKNGVEHAVPLSDPALVVLKSLPVIADERGKSSEFVFTTNGRQPVSGFSNSRDRFDVAITALLEASAKKRRANRIELPPRWTYHDLRRTVASGMARLGIALPVIEKILNHTSGSFAGVAGVYQRHSFADEKREAMEKWAKHVQRISDQEKVHA